jgi:hypothetical protein
MLSRDMTAKGGCVSTVGVYRSQNRKIAGTGELWDNVYEYVYCSVAKVIL